MIKLLGIPCIEAESADVLEIMRSPEPVQLTGKGITFSAQGYISITKQDTRQLAYAALHIKELQRSLILADSTPADDAGREKCEEFLVTMGFRLEPVNLKFSAAMRDVILREIPVILSPKTAREKEKTLAEWKRLVSEPVQENAGSTAAAARKTAAEKLAAEERINRKVPLLREIVDDFLRQVNSGPMADAERIDRENLQNLLTAAQEKTEKLETRILQLEEELKEEKSTNQQLAREKKMAGALIAESRQQLALAEKARDREIEARRVGELTMRDAEKRLSTANEAARRMQDLLATASSQRAQLIREKESAENLVLQVRQEMLQAGERFQAEVARHQKSREEVLAKLAVAEDELRQAQAMTARAVPAGMSAVEEETIRQLRSELQQAQALIAHGDEERTRLARALEEATRKNEQTAVPAGMPATAEEEDISRLRNDLRLAVENGEFLRLELDRMRAEKAALQKNLAKMEERAPDTAAAPTGKTAANDSVKNQSEAPPHVVRRPPPADAVFRVDWDLAGIPYDGPEDVCEIRQTMNRVRLSLEGYPDQYCSACLVVTKSGEKKNVFVSFRLSASSRVLVFVPVNPPETPSAFAKTLKEAEKFLQVVGLDLEDVPLSKNPRQRAKTLEGISVLIHPPPIAGNF